MKFLTVDEIVVKSKEFCENENLKFLTTDVLLYNVVKHDTAFRNVLKAFNVNPDNIEADLAAVIDQSVPKFGHAFGDFEATDEVKEIIVSDITAALLDDDQKPLSVNIVFAIFDIENCHSNLILEGYGLSTDKIVEFIKGEIIDEVKQNRGITAYEKKALEEFTVNLNISALRKRSDPLIGRET